MAVSDELKEILACPKCKGELEFRDAAAEIRCVRCRLVFRVEGDIPVMLLEEAKPLEG
ncbi:MAG TPA: Trm112 family protein [Anaeromyxobacter sp.]|nr:Trm112 family protein [Anaeromyxobacter sp.]